MSVKGFINNTNYFLGVCYRRTFVASVCCLVTLFRKITEIFADNKRVKEERGEKDIRDKEE
jgi:hypothetical protein